MTDHHGTVEIRRCAMNEVRELMRFLDEHWQAGHVLSTSKALMDWQHLADDGHYNYFIARAGNRIVGVLGYISITRFDPRLQDRNVLWLALWKVREDCGVPGLGLRLLNTLSRAQPHAALAVNGINLAHPPMYKALGFQVEELSQHILVNPNKRQTLMQAPSNWTLPNPSGTGTKLTRLHVDQLDAMPNSFSADDVLPGKTPAYFRKRFLEHPFYRYMVFQLRSSTGSAGLLALRVAEHEGRRAVRIVDFSGDAAVLASCGAGIEEILQEEDAEYADFWEFGLPQGLLAASGFHKLNPAGSLVVPNYFEPYLSRNARILCAFKHKTRLPFRVFRADGDQDRPNSLQTLV